MRRSPISPTTVSRSPSARTRDLPIGSSPGQRDRARVRFDERRPRHAGEVPRLEVAAAQQGGLQSALESGTDGETRHPPRRGEGRPSRGQDLRRAGGAFEGQVRGLADREDAGDAADLGAHRGIEAHQAPIVGIPLAGQRQREGHHPLGVEAGVDGDEVPVAAHEKGRARKATVSTTWKPTSPAPPSRQKAPLRPAALRARAIEGHRSRRPTWSAGSRPATRPATRAPTRPAIQTGGASARCSLRGSAAGPHAARAESAPPAAAIPIPPPARARRSTSPSSCRARRPGPAPKATRGAISPSRSSPRARSTPPTSRARRSSRSAAPVSSRPRGRRKRPKARSP